jgi:hypothetical protein
MYYTTLPPATEGTAARKSLPREPPRINRRTWSR